MLVPDVESAKPPFPEAFKEGAAARGKKICGRDRQQPARTLEEHAPRRRVHAILSVYADDPERLRDVLSELRARMEGAAEELDQFPAHRLDGKDVEHFDFEDGLSQPTIEGLEPRVGLKDPFTRVPAGEFVLGLDTQREDPWETDAGARPQRQLRGVPRDGAGRARVQQVPGGGGPSDRAR